MADRDDPGTGPAALHRDYLDLYFSNPFVNAGNVKPDFSSTKSPSKYKVQTLKNVLLLLMLEPFIDAGIVHMVPDPSDFSDIRHVLWNMAGQRVGEKVDFDDKDLRRNRALLEDDMMRANRGLPDDALHGADSDPELAGDGQGDPGQGADIQELFCAAERLAWQDQGEIGRVEQIFTVSDIPFEFTFQDKIDPDMPALFDAEGMELDGLHLLHSKFNDMGEKPELF